MSKTLYLIARTLSSPLEAIYTLLIFILAMELKATPFQLTVMACIKPTMSLFAYYANTFIIGRPSAYKPFLIGCAIISLLPCLFFPYFSSAWFYIAAYSLFMIAVRASYPAWIEILRKRLSLQALTRTVAQGSAINYGAILVLPVIFSYFMDQDKTLWKYLFVGMAFVQILNLFVLLLVPKLSLQTGIQQVGRYGIKEGWKLLSEYPSFSRYLIMFFLGGAGIVALQPILPIYFKETLHLSYVELSVAFSFLRGLAFLLTSPLWVRYASQNSLFALNSWVNTLSTFFIFFLLIAPLGREWLLIAYLFYGAMQAGCELSWNISGPYFSKEQDSIPFSSLNLCFISLRGILFAFLGDFLFKLGGALPVFYFAAFLCLVSIFYALQLHYKEAKV